MKKIRAGKYKHYKGKTYEVLGLGRHSETLKEYVIYRALYNSKKFGKNALWARPLNLFTKDVLINGEKVPRFKYIGK